MELNKTTSKKEDKTVRNPEGTLVNKRLPEIQLYLEASNFKVNIDSFYKSSDEKLDSLLEKSRKQNQDYVIGLSKYLADKGMKLSPVVLNSILADRNYSFYGENCHYIYNTPKRIAESLALQDMNYVKLNNSFKKNILKKSLEDMKKITLMKNKMLNRKIKTKDIIKYLRPKPKTKEMEDFYKALIEDRKETKLKGEDMVSTISDSQKKKEDKKEWIKNNIDNIPINQLVRNLKYISDNFEFDELQDIRQNVVNRLNSVTNYRFLNIFDVIEASMVVEEFQKPLFKVIKDYVEEFKKEYNFDEEADILFDISGSMGGFGLGLNSLEKRRNNMEDIEFEETLNLGFKYLVLFALLYKVKDENLAYFSGGLFDIKHDVISEIQKGNIRKAKGKFAKIYEKYVDGTALLDSIEKLHKRKNVNKNFVVISDEVSWMEGDDLTGRISDVSKLISDKNVVLVNPSVYEGTTFSNNILGVSGLTPTILTDILVLTKPQEFIRYIKNYKKVEKDNDKKQEPNKQKESK